jgi:hypothetical protein
MEVHAWYVNGDVGADDGGVVLKQHPDWAMADSAGSRVLWYDLGQPAVRRFESDLMVDVLERYDVDGVHSDYIRHNGRATCWCDRCRAAFHAQTGLNPADFRSDAVPCTAAVASNPLAQPTTAKVLARFPNGVAAIYLNELGRGQVLGVNYHAESLSEGFAKEAVQRFLAGAETAKSLPIIYPPETERDYGRGGPEAFAQELRGLGRQAGIVAGATAAELPAQGAAALVCAYRVPEALAGELVAWVEGGGRLVIVDGPVFSMGLAPMQKLTGMAEAGPYFSATVTVRPGEPNALVPTRDKAPDEAEFARFQEAWAKFQEAGPTALVRDVYRRAKALRPQAKVTAAVFPDRAAADSVCQDWYGWLSEGIVDYVIPMCYVMDSKALEADLDEWLAFDPKLERILPGLSIYQQADGKEVPRPPELVTDQVTRCLKRGSRGVCLFVAGIMDEPIAAALRNVKAVGSR